jgi:hypothetical protein
MINHDINPFINDEYDLTKKILLNHLNSKSNCSIGTITAINASPVSVNIQPSIKYFDKIEGFLECPILQNIPIAQISNSISSVRMPLNVGDVGIILWFDREVYSWLNSASTAPKSPDSAVLYNESACIFIPFIQKFANSPTIKTTGVDILSSNVSLMTELISTLNNISTTLTNITSILTDLTTFNTALIAAGVPYAGAPAIPVVGAYPIAVTAAATASNLTIVTIASSISAVTSAISTITTQMTTFKGAQ